MTSPHTTGAEPASGDEGTAVSRPKETTTPGARDRLAWQQPAADIEKDIVEEAGQGSFPGSDPPSWSGAVAR